MVQNFAELRKKNNLDLSTKRLRLNEYVASMLSLKLGESVNYSRLYDSNIIKKTSLIAGNSL